MSCVSDRDPGPMFGPDIPSLPGEPSNLVGPGSDDPRLPKFELGSRFMLSRDADNGVLISVSPSGERTAWSGGKSRPWPYSLALYGKDISYPEFIVRFLADLEAFEASPYRRACSSIRDWISAASAPIKALVSKMF